MDLEKTLLISTIAFTAGVSIGQYFETLNKLHSNPFLWKEYEESLKIQRWSSVSNFFAYYCGYPGRTFAYRYFDNPSHWG